MTSVGDILRNSRLGKEWTPEAASRVTKIRVAQLLALERNDFSKFAAPAYARGFVRIYARCLGLDEKAILQQLDGTFEGDDDDMFVQVPAVGYVPERIRIPTGTPANVMGWRIIVFGFLAFLVIAGICIGVYLQMASTTTRPGGGMSIAPTTPAAPSSSQAPGAATGPAVDARGTPTPPPAGPVRPGTTGQPSFSTEPDVPAAPRAPTVTVPPAPSVPASGPATAAAPGPDNIPTAPIAADPADGPILLRLGSQMDGLRIMVKRTTTRKGVVTENIVLNNGQSHGFRGSYFEIHSAMPSATTYAEEGKAPQVLDPDTSEQAGYTYPLKP